VDRQIQLIVVVVLLAIMEVVVAVVHIQIILLHRMVMIKMEPLPHPLDLDFGQVLLQAVCWATCLETETLEPQVAGVLIIIAASLVVLTVALLVVLHQAQERVQVMEVQKGDSKYHVYK